MWALVSAGLLATVWVIAWRRSDQPAFDFCCLGLTRGIARVYYNIWIRRRAPFPPAGACLLVANHTCSADPAFLQACARRSMSFLIAEEYFNIPGASRLFRYMQCIPVSRTGRDIKAVRIALQRLKNGRIVCLFPEGSLSGTGRGRMRATKRGAAYLALRSGVPVYPAFICGGPQHTYVPTAWLMPTRGGVTIGKPLDLSAYRGRHIDRKTVEEVGTLLVRAVTALDPHAGKPRKPHPPLGENPYDRKRRRSRHKFNHENTNAESTNKTDTI
jgi:1-acyl-sn-glycerol-3-phosphate acyltransferase